MSSGTPTTSEVYLGPQVRSTRAIFRGAVRCTPSFQYVRRPVLVGLRRAVRLPRAHDWLRLVADRPFSYYSPATEGSPRFVPPETVWSVVDFEIPKLSRRCAASDREFQPGECFYSVLVPRGAEVVRQDYAVDAWQGPPEDALGWWRSEVPDPKARQISWAPNDVMLHYFEQLEGQEPKRSLRYVLALLMIRRRIFKLEATEQDDSGQEVMIVYCSRKEHEYRVPVEVPTADQIVLIQEELAQLLFAQGS